MGVLAKWTFPGELRVYEDIDIQMGNYKMFYAMKEVHIVHYVKIKTESM